MTAITFSGLSSGFDAASLIDSLVSAEKTPETAIQAQEAATQQQISTLGDLLSRTNALGTILKGFSTASGAHALSVSSSNTSAVSATISGTPRQGTYVVNVSQLATSQTSASKGFASDSPGIVGTGTLSLAQGSGSPINISYDSSDSLTSIAAKINAQAGTFAAASVVNDGTSFHLVVDAVSSGSAGAITFGETGNTLGLSAPGANLVAAQDAKFSINGLAVTRSNNTVTDVVSGMTLSLGSVTAGSPATISVATDTQGVAQKMQSLVDNYNALVQGVDAQTNYAGTQASKGSLFGDRTVLGLRRDLGAAMSDGYGAANVSAGTIGITLNSDGTISLDQTKLSAALAADPQAVNKLLSGDGTNGLTAALQSVVTRYADPINGQLTVESAQRSARLPGYADQIAAIEDRGETLRAALTKSFANLDQVSQSYKNQASYLTQINSAALSSSQ